MTGGSLFPSGRQRLLQEHITLSGTLTPPRLNVQISTAEYPSIPADAHVTFVLKASNLDRRPLHLGTWGAMAAGASVTLPVALTEGARPGCRLMVSDPSHTGKLLATAENLTVVLGTGPMSSTSLLNSQWDDLGQIPWVLELQPPLLKVNTALKEFPQYESLLRPLLLPEIVRRVAEWLLDPDAADDETVVDQWLTSLTDGSPDLREKHDDLRDSKDQGERDAWVSDVVKRMTDHRKPLDEFLNVLKQRG